MANNTGQRLVEISRLSSGTAAQHLRAAGVTGITAGELLTSYSRLATATAAVHLLQTVQREIAGGVPKFRRMATTPYVVAEARFGWAVEFPSLFVGSSVGGVGLMPLPVSGVITPTVVHVAAPIVVKHQEPIASCSTGYVVSAMYSAWDILSPSTSAFVPFAGRGVHAAIAPTIIGVLRTDSTVSIPKSIRNPTEQELIAALFY